MRATAKAAFFAVSAALALSGCGSSDNSTLAVAVIGSPDDPFSASASLPLAGQLVRASTGEGLVAFDAEGRVINALADRWIVTDDGLSYIFRLRDGNWRNGDEITAKSAKQALDAALKAQRDTPLGLDLEPVEEVRVMASRVIEIRLARPMPFLLQLLAQPQLGLEHDKQGGGPMVVERTGEVARLTSIEPSQLGLPEVADWSQRTRRIVLHALPGPEAVDSFNGGQTDLVLGGRVQDFPLTRSVGILRGTIQLDPVAGLFGLQVAHDKGFLELPENREAIAMAIDRDSLMKSFGVDGWSPTTRVVAAGLDDDAGTIGERWTDQSLEQRRAVAAGRVQRWLVSQGDGARPAGSGSRAPAPAIGRAGVGLSIWLPPGEGSDMIFGRLGDDLTRIGIAIRRADNAKDADLRLVDEVARYPRAIWYLNRLSCRAGHGLCDSQIDASVADAAETADAATRAALLTGAETRLTAANYFIPFGSPIRWSLVRGSVNGFAANGWGWHPLMPLAWLPK